MKKTQKIIIASISIFLVTIASVLIPLFLFSNNLQLTLTELGQIDTGGAATKVKVVGEIAYVIDITDNNPGGLVIIDVSDPTNPQRLSSYYDGGLPRSIHTDGETAFIANGFTSISGRSGSAASIAA